MDYKTLSINKTRSIIRPDPSSNNKVDIILIYLPLNTKQKIIVCKIIHYTIYNQITFRSEHLNQLLLIIRDKSGISKSQVIKAIN